MQFFCYHRDRDGSTPLRAAMVEEHWAYMDRFDLVERGPTFRDDEARGLTGSVHVVDLPDVAAARAFVFDEPYYQAGAYRDVLLRRTEWQVVDTTVTSGFLGIGFTAEPTYVGAPAGVAGFGPLLTDDGDRSVGLAVLAPTADAARAALAHLTAVEVHLWERGGRR